MDVPIQKKAFSTKKLGLIGGVVAIIALMFYVITTTSGGAKLNVEKERISISTVTNAVFQENIPVNGIVLPITTIYLDALEGGRVEEKFVEDGAILKRANPF